jgi:hypothetical protein
MSVNADLCNVNLVNINDNSLFISKLSLVIQDISKDFQCCSNSSLQRTFRLSVFNENKFNTAIYEVLNLFNNAILLKLDKNIAIIKLNYYIIHIKFENTSIFYIFNVSIHYSDNTILEV